MGRSLAKLVRMKSCLEKPKLVGAFWQSCGHQQNQYEKTFGVATVLIGYFGNLMATITTDMNISLEHSKFLWITSAISRSTAKLVRKDAWNSQGSLDYSGNLAVTNKTGMKRPWEQPTFVEVILEILWLPSQPTRKSAWNIQSSYGLYWQSSGYQQNWHNYSSYRLFWQSYGWQHNRYENELATDSKMYRNSIGGANIV